MKGNGRSAWGLVLKMDVKTFLKGSCINHGRQALVAEITMAQEAFKAALGDLRQKKEQLKGVMHCMSVMMDICQAINALSMSKFSTSHEKVRGFRERSGLAQVRRKWVPGHSGIIGNEEADAAARSFLRTIPCV